LCKRPGTGDRGRGWLPYGRSIG